MRMAALRGGSCSCVDLIVRARRLRFVGVATIGARSVEDNFRWLVLRLGNAAEEEVADVGHDRSPARGNAALGNEDEEAREHVVDFASGFKLFQLADESSAEVRFLADEALAEMVGADAGAEIRDGHTAAATGWKRVLAAGGVGEGFLKTLDLTDCSFIFRLRSECWVCHPGCFRKSGKQRTCGSMSA